MQPNKKNGIINSFDPMYKKSKTIYTALEFTTNRNEIASIPVDAIDHLIDLALAARDEKWFRSLIYQKTLVKEARSSYVHFA